MNPLARVTLHGVQAAQFPRPRRDAAAWGHFGYQMMGGRMVRYLFGGASTQLSRRSSRMVVMVVTMMMMLMQP
jgi:hypothetical protein